jgi:hypothetical protein
MRGPSKLLYLIPLLALTACWNDTEYRFASETTPLIERNPDPEDLKLFNESFKKFANDHTELIAKSGQDFAFPVFSAYQTGLTLLAASEGDSYVNAALFLRTKAPDEYSLVQGYNQMSRHLAKTESIKFGACLWMIWPIPLHANFENDMAQRLGADLVQLGSVGQTSVQALDRWNARFTPKLKAATLDRSEPMIATAALNLTTSDQIQVSTQGEVTSAMSKDFVVLTWPATTGQFFPNDFNPNPEPGQAKSATQFVSISNIQILESVPDPIRSGPNNFPHLSAEIVPTGDAIGIRRFLMSTQATLIIDKKVSGRVHYMVLDRRTNLPVLTGRTTLP